MRGLLAPDRPANRIEILMGRSLALSAHPQAAWRVLPPAHRGLLVFGYFTFSYLTVLAALQLFAS